LIDYLIQYLSVASEYFLNNELFILCNLRFRACSGGHLEAADVLIQNGADVNAVNHMGETPLHRGAWKNHLGICKLLIEHGASPSRTLNNKDGKTPLDLARVLEVKTVVAPPMETGSISLIIVI
jgi:ankyrin repeat protein